MQKHGYLNMIYNKNPKDLWKKLTLLPIMEISEIRLS